MCFPSWHADLPSTWFFPLLSILTAAALRRQEGLDESLPSPRVAANCIHQTQYAGKLWGGKNSSIYALLFTDNQVTILPRPVRENLGWDQNEKERHFLLKAYDEHTTFKKRIRSVTVLGCDRFKEKVKGQY